MTKAKVATKTLEVQKGFLNLRVAPETIKEDSRTVTVVVAVGTRGKRLGFFSSDYFEELEISSSAIRLDRIMSSGVGLVNHDTSDVENIIAVPDRVWIESGQLMATMRFDEDEKSERIFQKVKRGFIRNVSVGYYVHRYEELEEKQDDLPVFRAVDWEPAEISFVTIPFDRFAQVRNEEGQKSKCIVETIEGDSKMGKRLKKREDEEKKDAVDSLQEAIEDKKEEAQKEDEKEEQASEDEKEEQEAEEKEEQASEEPKPEAKQSQSFDKILLSCEKAGLSMAFARGLVSKVQKREMSHLEARQTVIEEWAKTDKKVRSAMTIEPGSYDRMDVVQKGIENALLNRANPARFSLDDMGAEYRGMSLVDMARSYLDAVGIKSRNMYRQEVARKVLSSDTRMTVRTGFHGTSDFPEILANVANKTLRDAYERFPQTFRPWTRRNTAPDFKQISRTQLGEGPTLKKITEHGEYTYGTFGELAEKYALATYGTIVPVTRQLIINDDLMAFMRVPEALGLNAADLESDIIYAILTANDNMSDSNALFSAQHANLGTAGAISETTLSEMRKLGRQQKGIDGRPLNIVYQYLIVPAALETSAQKQVSAVVPNQTSGVNVFSALYQVIPEPRLDDVSESEWYAASSPGRVDTIEYSYLEGNESVFIDQEVEFDTDGIKIKARHDFAAKAIDWRGLFKNPYAGS